MRKDSQSTKSPLTCPEGRQSIFALPPVSDIDLLGNREGIVHLDTEIPDGAFDLSVPQEQLHGPQIARAAIDQRCLGSTKRMGTCGSSPMLATQSATSRAYCLVVMLRSEPFRPLNMKSPGFSLAALKYSSTACRVCSVNSNRTGWPVFLCRTVARSAA